MNKKAFTMIELTLVIVVLAIVSVVGVQVIRFTYEQRVRTQILNDLEVQSQVAIDYISKNTKNAIRNSIRVKKDYTSNCKNSTDCKFVYNINNDFKTYKVLEWANIDIDKKRAGWWDGINRTKCVIAQTLRADTTGVSKDFSTATGGTATPEPKCFDGSDSGQFLCFAFRHDVRTCNKYMLKPGRKYNRGIYFLGDNITNSNAFIENDLLNLEVKDDTKTSKISFDTKVKNFTITNAYVLVDRINGVKLDNNELKFYTLEWDKDIWSGTGKKSISVTNKYTLVKNVKNFNIQSLGDSIAFTLCLESKKEVSTSLFGTSKTKISVCKSGVML
ncbi:type II secretion system protein [Campylobacter canadensis]|uniref:type II secretion system protein n=1 Tax=Campylobacter canadensis TaxID=449520 RepID=UPI00155366C7|nr:type II secretion system protein [Campylobacter canadensis]MBZ7994666.1 type II secretion system protein [Campylobacter canadensis]MBZ7996162.1 type II secretion system protein [Campylobacter canadensis]MBZ8000022.1 type II secretion system protein [Campylobacter canadensis]MBZ8001593.1 type II secretion system protein [Campylobacter canadensis]MBZ8003313.1 type II secretion system protein [Campylobacter canadensis]